MGVRLRAAAPRGTADRLQMGLNEPLSLGCIRKLLKPSVRSSDGKTSRA